MTDSFLKGISASNPGSTSNQTPPDQEAADRAGKLTPLSVIASVFAAAFGVQSESNRKRDFAAGRPWVFILAGVIFTVVFVLTLVLIVRSVLPN